jgi:hypothetical protein
MIVRYAAAAAVLALLSNVALGNDFPTLDRVLFVESCIRDHPDRPRQEMLYKCSCALDAIAEEIAYDDYVELSTAADAGQIAGERGAAVRESSVGRDMTKKFRAVKGKAFSNCLIQ